LLQGNRQTKNGLQIHVPSITGNTAMMIIWTTLEEAARIWKQGDYRLFQFLPDSKLWYGKYR